MVAAQPCFRASARALSALASIEADGYRAKYVAPYRPDYVMRNHYLEIDGWCYWFIYPNMLNRERAEDRKHQLIPD